MKLQIPFIVTTVCILAMLSCSSKHEPGTADTAASQDSLDKSRLRDTPIPENHSQDMNATGHTAAIPSPTDNREKAKMPEQPHHPLKSVPEPKINTAGPAAAFANATDFICGMEVMPDYTDTCHLDGKVYAFCSEYCKDKFKENPKKYLEKK